MSYNIGQFTRFSLEDSKYKKDIPLATEEKNGETRIKIQPIKSPYNESAKDKYISLGGNNTFEAGKTYYLKTRLSGENLVSGENYTVKVKLIKASDTEEVIDYQIIKVIKNKFTSVVLVDLIFRAQYEFTHLVFEVQRTQDMASAITITPSDEILKTKMIEIVNVLSTDKINKSAIKKIGIQGPAGLKFAVNGEEIELNKTGIFTSEEMEITSVGFIIDDSLQEKDENGNLIPNPDGKMFFIMDYQY